MFERFTDRARKVLALANQEAQRLNHEYISAEHLLLGLILEGSGVGATVLKDLGVDFKQAKREIERRVAIGPTGVGFGKLPHEPSTKRVIERAVEEAQNLNHNYVGSEHLMLGLVRDEGIAGQTLAGCGVTIQDARERFVQQLGVPRGMAGESGRSPIALRADCPMCQTVASIKTNPSFIGELPLGYVMLGENQGPRGWCVLIVKGHFEHLADLHPSHQASSFEDVARVAAAIRSVFPTSGRDGGPPRINYECLGNLVPHIHWHVIPRHADDPEPTRAVWGWSEEKLRGTMSAAERAALVRKLREAIGGVADEPGA